MAVSEKYRKNYDKVFKKKRKKRPSGTYIMRDGELVLAGLEDLRVDDTPRECSPLGVNPVQVPEMNKRFGHLGVEFNPATGDPEFKGSPSQVRQSRLRFMKARGYFDRDEVRG